MSIASKFQVCLVKTIIQQELEECSMTVVMSLVLSDKVDLQHALLALLSLSLIVSVRTTLTPVMFS